jgi:DNA invertase Pin-like site-specific DNA recombinase
LLLGLKGTMSEAELHMLKGRLQAGRWAKARRGELFFNLPRGYVRRSSGDIALDPDEQVQATIRLVFDVFEHCRTINGVLAYCVTHTVSKVLFRKHLELSPYFRSDGELLEFTPATA